MGVGPAHVSSVARCFRPDEMEACGGLARIGLPVLYGKTSQGRAVIGPGDHRRQAVCEEGERAGRSALDAPLFHDDFHFLDSFQKGYHNYVYDSVFTGGQCGGYFGRTAAAGMVSGALPRGVAMRGPGG